jgi:glutamate-1-semialdehyde 2,1-aminomutase
MGAMQVFLRASGQRRRSQAFDRDIDERLERPRRRAEPSGSREAQLPVRVANLSSVWTVLYTRPSQLQLDAAVLPARRGLWR